MTRCLDLPGLAVTHLIFAPGLGVVFLTVHSTAPTACCPTCQQPSAHVHQYHTRLVRDLPWADRRAYLATWSAEQRAAVKVSASSASLR